MNRKLLGLIGFVALAALAGAKGNGCEPAPVQGETCGAGDACATGLTCVHYYGIAGPSGPEFRSCEIPCLNDGPCPTDQKCVFIADGPGEVCRPFEETECDPAVEQSCGPDEVCAASAVGDTGTCGAFQHGQSVGAGYACGGSIGVSCAEGLYCKGLPHNTIGGSGTCTLMTCQDWTEEYWGWMGAINHCSTAADCVSVAGTSCGCTRNAVVNQNEDLAGFEAMISEMNDAGCGIMSTCDCPAADGYACDHGVCGWNYL